MVIFIRPDVTLDGAVVSYEYTCKYYKDGNCTDYENRPEMCRQYPYGRACEKEACTWHPDDALMATGRVGDRPLRLFKDPVAMLQAVGPDQRLERKEAYEVVFTKGEDSWTLKPTNLDEFHKYGPGKTWHLKVTHIGTVTPIQEVK